MFTTCHHADTLISLFASKVWPHLLGPLVLLGEAVFVAEPPVHKDGPELHVEDDGVASEEAQLLVQQRPLLRPGHVMTLESRQLQASSLGLQAQTLVVMLQEEPRTMVC